MTLVSAHRGGAGRDRARENTREALEAACSIDCEYVEFDVQRLGDGTFVLSHDGSLLVDGRRVPLVALDRATFTAHAVGALLYEEALHLLRGRKKAHIDLKFLSPPALRARPEETWEVQATALAVEVLGTDHMIITTAEDESVRVVRAWAATRFPTLLVGLSLGKLVAGQSLLAALRMTLGELFPGRRVQDCDANLVVAHRYLARFTLARHARQRNLPLLVWTVDRARELSYWLEGDRAWLVTTNCPAVAVGVRTALTVAQA